MASKFKDYYELLGVSRSATLDDIKKAYRRVAREHHPDLHPDKEKDFHTKRMQEANEAYSVLSNPENRAKYDQFGEHWKEGPPPPPPPSGGREGDRFSGQNAEAFSDFFQNLFRQRRGQEAARDFYPSELDVEAELELSLEEAFHGVEKTLTLMTTGLCPTCHGSGRVARNLCRTCGGVGEIRRPRDIKAKIPAGLLDGGRIRLKGQGNEGPHGRGDLYLTIHLLPHTRFSVEGKDLTLETTIRPWQAVLGSETTVQTLDGPVRIRVSKGTHAGRRLRLAGKGLGKPGERGDLLIRLTIDIPDTLSPQVEMIYKQLSATEGAANA
jgi:curved DNA-binding protein